MFGTEERFAEDVKTSWVAWAEPAVLYATKESRLGHKESLFLRYGKSGQGAREAKSASVWHRCQAKTVSVIRCCG